MTCLADLDVRLIEAHADHPWLGRHPQPERRTYLRTRLAAPEPLYTSSLFDDCLIHMVRLVTVLRDATTTRGVMSMCGAHTPHARFVPVADAVFVCRKCHAKAEGYGVDTFGLIPDGGCAVSGGKRGRPQ